MTTYINPGNNTGLYGLDDIVINTGYGNANVESFLATGSDTGGNVVGNIVATGNVTGTYFFGNGSQLSGIASSYGNANVEALLAAGITSNVITTANVSGNYILGNGSQLTGLPATYGNSNVATFLANFGSNTVVTTGNITGGNFIGSGAALTSITGANVTGTVANATYATSAGTATSATTAGTVTTAAQPNITSTGTLTSVTSTGNITSVSGYFVGDGSKLSNISAGNIVGGYGNSNVATFLASFGSNTITTTGNISGGNLIGTHVGSGAALSSLTGANVTGTVANATYAVSAGSATTAGTVTTAAQPNITSTGTLTSVSSTGNITGANLVATTLLTGPQLITTGGTGNITGANYVVANYFQGDGSLLTNLPIGSYGNSNVTSLLASFGSNTIVTTGNITGGNLNTSGTVSTSGSVQAGTTISAAGNVHGGNLNTAGTVSTSGAVVAGTTISAVGNVSGGNVSTVGNVTGAYIKGDGSQLTNLPGGTYGDSNVVTLMASFGSNTITTTGNISGGNLNTSGTVSTSGAVVAGTTVTATGNIAGGNLTTAGQVTATGNITGGNIVINGSNMKSTNAWDANTTPQQARITMGTGYDGDFTSNYDPLNITRGSQFAVINKQLIANADTNQGLRLTTSTLYADLGGATLTNTSRRMQGLGGFLWMGNGTQSMSASGYFGASGAGGTVVLGNSGNVAMGNVTVGHVAGATNAVQLATGGTAGNAIGSYNQINALSATGTVTNAIGAASLFGGSPTTSPTTVIGYYMPNATATYGISNSTNMRKATNYYFLKNDDDAAQNQMGSLRAYTEFNAQSSTTSGSLTIDKTAGQVQQVDLTGDVTTLAFSNFVSSASDGTNTDEQCDTVTIIFNQGATGGYDVTFPTGSTYKYAGDITALQGTTADSVTLVSVSAIRISGTTTYLITISPEFV